MPIEASPLVVAALALAAAWLCHSTVCVALAWIIARLSRGANPALHDLLWKTALVLPLLTAPLHQWQVVPGPDWLTVKLAVAAELPTELVAVATTEAVAPAVTEPRSKPAPTVESAPLVAALPPSTEAPRIDGEDVVKDPRDLSAADLPGESFEQLIETERHIEIRPGPSSAAAVLDSDAPVGNEPPNHPVSADAATRIVITPGPASVRHDAAPSAAAADVPNIPATISPSRQLRPAEIAAADTPPLWPRGLLALLAAVAVMGGLRLLRTAWDARRCLLAATRLDSGPEWDCLRQILKDSRTKQSVRLLASDAFREPAACGVKRWTICVPPALADRLPPQELRALLAHEVAHLRRRDTVWLGIFRAVCRLLPWQPLNTLACRYWRRAAEQGCDGWAVESGVAPLVLAKCLARVAEWRVAGAPDIGLTAAGTPSLLSRRIENLAAGAIPNTRLSAVTRAAAACVACLAAIALSCGPRVETQASSGLPEPLALMTAAPSTQPTDDAAAATVAGDPLGASETEFPALDAERDSTASAIADLLADLGRIDGLLAVEHDPELDAVRESLRRRIDAIARRLQDRHLSTETSLTSQAASETSPHGDPILLKDAVP